MKKFTYYLGGYAEVEATTQEEADKKLWDMTLLEANMEVDSVEIEEEEEQKDFDLLLDKCCIFCKQEWWIAHSCDRVAITTTK